jgi:hypothetical protein
MSQSERIHLARDANAQSLKLKYTTAAALLLTPL